MAMTWMTLSVFLASFWQSAIAANAIATANSHKFLASESSASITEASTPEEEPRKARPTKRKPRKSHPTMPQVDVGIKVSEDAQKCFTPVVFGRSPGSNLGNSSETSVDNCMSKCAALEGCLAMTFRLSDGLCNFLNRTYEGKLEESHERLVANKLDNCLTQEPQESTKAKVEMPKESKKQQKLSKAKVEMPKVSEQMQNCFSDVVFGKSPGSNIGNSTETSVDDCMSKCAASEGCLAMTFRLDDGLCNLLDRTYEGKYEKTDERVVANKLDSCEVESSAANHEVSQKAQVLPHDASQNAQVLPKVSKDAKNCFTEVVFGRSPGSNSGNSTEFSVDECMLKCEALNSCLAMSFRLSDGLCNFLDRTYDGKFEESDERLLANKRDSCVPSRDTQVFNQADVAIKVSEKAQKCFTNVVFGRSPGSNMGNTTEASVDDCMTKCETQKGCLAMTFRLSDGLCNFLDRTYEGKYEESNERLLANRLDKCGISSKKSFGRKVFDVFAFPFKAIGSLFTMVFFGFSLF